MVRLLDDGDARAHLLRVVKQRTATELSASRRTASGRFGPILGLARQSHGRLAMLLGLGLGALFSTGCLVAEAPEYGPPRQTTPVIKVHDMKPEPFSILVPTTTTNFNVPIKSEDAGEGVIAALFVDFETEADRDWEFPPETRELIFAWQPRVSKGCHLLKLIVTHSGNYDKVKHRYKSDDDLATFTWWMNVEADDPTKLENCPSPTDSPNGGA